MFHLVAKNIKMIFVWAVVLGLASGLVSLLFPKQYSAESQVLIISRDRTGVDPYTQAKSAERIGENLAQVMNTSDFYGKVMESTDVPFNKDRWQALAERDRRKAWQKDVQSAMVYNSSMLKITVYSDTKDDATAFANAITQTLVSRGWEYVGGDVALKEVSTPLVSRFIARPNLLVNTAAGFLIGGLLAVLWITRYKRHHLFGNA